MNPGTYLVAYVLTLFLVDFNRDPNDVVIDQKRINDTKFKTYNDCVSYLKINKMDEKVLYRFLEFGDKPGFYLCQQELVKKPEEKKDAPTL